MSALVVDASVAVKWYVRQSDSAVAERVLAGSADLHAPDFQQVEFTNAVWKYQRATLIGEDQANLAMATLPKAVTFWHETPPLLGDAFALARRMDHPVYDCIYLALAIRLDCPVVTADRKFAGRFATGGHAGGVVFLHEWDG